jgi:hypothetical protein
MYPRVTTTTSTTTTATTIIIIIIVVQYMLETRTKKPTETVLARE